MSLKQIGPYKYIVYFVTAFIACYLTQIVLLNRFISLGSSYYITGGTFIYFTAPLIVDVVAEVYGYKTAKQMLWGGLFALFFMGICIKIVLNLPYPTFWTNVIISYHISLDSVERTCIISSISIFIGQNINAYLISKWKILTKGRYFWLRSLGSSVFGDSITVVISIIGIFMGRIPSGMMMKNIVPELIIMIIFTAVGAIPASCLVKITVKAEGIDVYDTSVVYNPFIINEEA